MSTNAPWMPSAGAATEHTGGNGPAPSSAPQELIDPNDPRLISEPLDVAVDKDAYAQPVPLPDRIWRAKLKLEGVKSDNGERKDYAVSSTRKAPILPYFQTGISASIIGTAGFERFEGIVVYPAFGGYVSTLMRKDKSTTVATVLSKLTRPDGKPWVTTGMRLGHKDWIDMLVQALAGEPEAGVETQWEWSCATCGTEMKALRDAGKSENYPTTIRGMNRFPAQQDKIKRAAGDMYDPEMQCRVNAGHGYSRAYPKIVRFLSLAELK